MSFYDYGMTRKQRAKTQNLFLIETKDIENSKEYTVMGSTGNVYKVIISNKPTCTCPDYKLRKRRCKHIYFILIRVMKVKEDEEETSVFSSEALELMFKNIPKITENLIVNKNIKDKYNKYQSKDKKDTNV